MPHIVEIEGFSSPELDVYARLTGPQLRREGERGVCIAEGTKVILAGLEAGCRPRSLLMERRQMEGPAREVLSRVGEVPVYTASREVLSNLTGYALTRGYLCAFDRPEPVPAQTLVRQARRLVVLDGVRDAENLGSILRSAAAMGMEGVLMTPSCGDVFSRRALRVSMGTAFRMPFARIPEHEWPAMLGQAGVTTLALTLSEDARPVETFVPAAGERVAVALGSEGDGLDSAVAGACAHRLVIPMQPGVESLNVGCAAAIAFYLMGTARRCGATA